MRELGVGKQTVSRMTPEEQGVQSTAIPSLSYHQFQMCLLFMCSRVTEF
jgi:hypothetical protein